MKIGERGFLLTILGAPIGAALFTNASCVNTNQRVDEAIKRLSSPKHQKKDEQTKLNQVDKDIWLSDVLWSGLGALLGTTVGLLLDYAQTFTKNK